MKNFSNIIPSTNWGRSIFMLFLNRVFFGFIVLPYYLFDIFSFSDFFQDLKRGCFNISEGCGWFYFTLEVLFAVIERFINIGFFEISIVWLLVYCVFRFTRNRKFVGNDFFWISVITCGIEYLTHIVASYFYGEINVGFVEVTMFLACSISAYYIFRLPEAEQELPKVYLMRLISSLIKSKIVWCLCIFYITIVYLTQITTQ